MLSNGLCFSPCKGGDGSDPDASEDQEQILLRRIKDIGTDIETRRQGTLTSTQLLFFFFFNLIGFHIILPLLLA